MAPPIIESRGPIIYINAFPGTGKSTIAKHLASLFETGTIKLGHRLFINAAEAGVSRDHPGYQQLVCEIRQVMFNSVVENATTHSSAYVFTDFQTANNPGIDTGWEYFVCAAQRRCYFIPITLNCKEEENLQRLASVDRAIHGKPVDVELAKESRRNSRLQTFEGHRNAFRLDVTDLSAEEAAVKIMRHAIKICPLLGAHVKY